jgi:glutathione synthase/RimK-type ligase-like ATP-grasp enzyme
LIAVVSYAEDPHAVAVMAHLRELGARVELLDLSELPDRATLAIGYPNGGAPTLEYLPEGRAPIDLRDVRAFWWRRPQVANPEAIADPAARLFAANEWQEAIAGLWQLVDARWINDPVRDEVAARKALQLQVATEVGLAVPRTLVTSDPGRARAFLESRPEGETVFKTFSCTHEVWRETRLVTEADVAELEAVRLAPVIFQEYVRAEVDLRITAVDGRLFTAAIHSQSTDYPVDFRMSLGQAEVEADRLPAEVEQLLLELLRRLGLVYGAIDLRRTPAGDHVFLEVNTAGEFLFVEERTGQPIARAVAEALAR